MSLTKKIKTFLSGDFDDEETYDDYEEETHAMSRTGRHEHSERTSTSTPKLTTIQGNGERASRASAVLIFEPRSISEAKDVTDSLKQRSGVIVNLQRMPQDQARSMIDFLSGAVYALDGQIEKIGPETFICAPTNIDLSGNITDYLGEKEWS
ncbi:MAG: cell division protein SepF [Bacilli bacterium]